MMTKPFHYCATGKNRLCVSESLPSLVYSPRTADNVCICTYFRHNVLVTLLILLHRVYEWYSTFF